MTQTEKLFLAGLLLAGFSKPTESVGDAVLLIVRVVLAILFVMLPMSTGGKGAK